MPLPNTNTAASAAQIGYGAAFWMGSGSGPAYTLIAECKEIKPSGITVGEEDVTNLGSPGGVREFIPTLVEYGTLEISGNYTGDASQIALETAAVARTIFPFKFAFPVAGGKNETRLGNGFITKYVPGDHTVDKVPSFTCTMRITGVESEAQA